MKPRLSILVAARKNSKYLAKFLFGLFENTARPEKCEVLVMLNSEDTWNSELIKHFTGEPYGVRFYQESYGLGRAGLHMYFNDLYKQASGDWIIYFCEDHFITYKGWDDYLWELVAGTLRVKTELGPVLKHELGALNPNVPYCIVPQFDNAGAMNHMLSRGYCEAIGGKMGGHGWIDSYINDVNQLVFGRFDPHVLRTDEALFHDFTHDHPNPMSDAHQQSASPPAGEKLPAHGGGVYEALINEDATRLRERFGGAA